MPLPRISPFETQEKRAERVGDVEGAVLAMHLRHFSRFGVPLDVVYGPHQPQGEPLPELLTPGILIRALDHAAVSASAEAHLH